MKIKDLALGFQQAYFDGKYEIDSTLTSDQDSLFVGQNLPARLSKLHSTSRKISDTVSIQHN